MAKKKKTLSPELPTDFDFDFSCSFGNMSCTEVDSITVTIDQKMIAKDMPSAFNKLWRHFAYRTVDIVLVSGQEAYDDQPGQTLIENEAVEILPVLAETHSVRTSGRTKFSITLTMKDLSDLNVIALRHLKNTNGRIQGHTLDPIPVKKPGRKKKDTPPDPEQGQFDDEDQS